MISKKILSIMNDSANGVIRKMFEEGALLKKQYGADKVYDFSIGNPNLNPPEELLLSLKKHALDNCLGVHGYMSNAGYEEARTAMAKKTTAEQGVVIPFGNIIMAVGAAGAINCVFKAILDNNDEVIVPSPYFGEYRHYIQNYGGAILTVNTNEDFSLNLNNIAKSLTEKTKALILNSPNNPTGKVYTASEIEKLVSILKAHNKKFNTKVYLILDEPYRAIVYDGVVVPPVFPLYEYTIVVTSFAKSLSIPGERIGYVAVNNSDESDLLVSAITLATRILGFVNAPALFQRVVADCYDTFVDYTAYNDCRKAIMAIMDSVGLKYIRPEGAFYLFVKVPDSYNGDDERFCAHLKEFNILCAPGVGFGKSGWFRISYCVTLATIKNSIKAWQSALQ